MKSSLSTIIIFLILGVFLGGLIVFGITRQEKIEKELIISEINLYSFSPIEKVYFNAKGKVVGIDEEKITIERLEERISIKLTEETRIVIVPEIEERDLSYESKSGEISDIHEGRDVSIFGVQEKDGSLISETILIDDISEM